MVRGKSDALSPPVERVSAPAERGRPKYVADFLDPDLPIHFRGRLDQRPSPFRRRIRHLAFIAPGRDRFCGRLPPGILEGPQRSSSSDVSSSNCRLIRLFCGGCRLADPVSVPSLFPLKALRHTPHLCSDPLARPPP